MSAVALDIETIYNYNTHRNIPWNMVQYQPLREYLDPNKIIENRKLKQGGAQVKKYVTKRGSFLDQHIKAFKDLPSSCTYDYPGQFDQTQHIKEGKKHKIDFKLRKNSYLQQIESKAKRYKSPSVGQYKLQSQQKKQKSNKHQSKDQKRFFYQDSEFLSTVIPGSGAYNPHDFIPSTRKQRNDNKYWIKKHSQEKQKNRKRNLKSTDPGTYRPLSISFNTFDKINFDDLKKKKKTGKNKSTHGFGSSDAKFDYERTKKSKADLRPDPCNYNTMIQWKGKGSDVKKNNWVRCLSAGPTRSVYH